MNKNSNTYIITYATIMVVVVAAVLAFTAIKLQPLQQQNVRTEKMGAILTTIGQGNDAKELSRNKDAYIQAEYDKYVTDSYMVDPSGNRAEGDAFAALDNLPEVFSAPESERVVPVFEATLANGQKQYIIPMTGKGLWGPVWGYLSLSQDLNTIAGAVLDHAGETPGLGAEIAMPAFTNQFVGKTLFDENGNFVGINLTKGVGSSAGNPHAVDAVSGGTLTSNGVKDMIKNSLENYVPFFKKITAPTVVNVEPVFPETGGTIEMEGGNE